MSGRLESGRFLGRTLRQKRVGDLMLADVQYSAGAPRHAHERAYFTLIRRGGYTERYGRRVRACRPMMLVLHPPGEYHSQTLDDVAAASFNVEIGPEWLHRMSECDAPLDQPAERQGGAAVDLAMKLFHAFHEDEPQGALTVESLTADILYELARKTTARRAPMPSWLRDVPDLIDEHRRRPLALRTLAAAAGVHPVYFAAVFRRHYGCSLGEYVRRRRFDYARQQIARPELSLAQVAADAGFADQSHLTRTFKRVTGLTPGEYRTFLTFKTR